MRITMNTLVRLLLLIASITIEANASDLNQQPLADCRPKLESRLGMSVTADVALYEVTPSYAMEVEFGKGCEIVDIYVAPKFAWEDKVPAWVEGRSLPSLNADEFRVLLSKINQLQSTGSLVKKGDTLIKAVTNSKTEDWDEYERAFIRRTMHCCGDYSHLMFSFKVFFFHKVEGKVQNLRLIDDNARAQITIDDQSYLMSPAEAKGVAVGKHAAVNVAGPVN